MLTKNNTKLIKSLQLKKFRQQEQLFIVEGRKNTLELLNSSYKIKDLLVTESFYNKYKSSLQQYSSVIEIVNEKTLTTLSNFKTNKDALAVVQETQFQNYQPNGFHLALDDIRDPGNLGTIIRIADWYNINSIICSETTAEFYNPKVISASMGSIFRINLYRENLVSFLEKQENRNIYGAVLAGKNLHEVNFQQDGILVIGNESHGIRQEISNLLTHQITIPKYGHAESLNAAMATAIICDNVLRTLK